MTCVYKKDAITYCITSENSRKVICCKFTVQTYIQLS